MALFKSMDEMANTVGTMFPGTIVPIPLELANFYSIITYKRGVHILAILTCPGCGRGGLRVPDGRRGKVTCPRCAAEWFYPEAIELSEVEFRCAQSGARFIVQLSRRSPIHKFVIQGITNAPAATSKASNSQEKTIPADGVSVAQLPKSRSSGWLAALFGKSSPAVPTITASTDVSEPKVAPAVTPLRHSASEYNWSSFLCPYCNASSFIRCSGGHLACDGTVEIRSGRRFHQCYCGNAGFIEGMIETIDANQRTVPIEPARAKFMTEGHATTTNVAAVNPIASSAVQVASPKEAVTESQKISVSRTPKLRDPNL
jgi:hypothetical protein